MIKTTWDYTKLAETYLNRPAYAPAAIDAMLSIADAPPGAQVCDIGAGAAHLTVPLAQRRLRIVAVEPNDAMRSRGINRTREFHHVRWAEGTGEMTGQADASFDLATFGSSFNVCDRPRALQEVARILKPQGWFACMWNHRNLADPVQQALEQVIVDHLGAYDYGSRREDQTAVIEAYGRFGPVCRLEADVCHVQSIEDCVAAWRSHGTLQRQAGDRFATIVRAMESFLRGLATPHIKVPYTTRIWMAPLQ